MPPAKGIHLFEVIIVLFLLSLLMGASIPSMRELLAARQASSALDNLRDAIALAKSLAISTRTPATLCRSRDGRQCSGDWHDGAIVFLDSDQDHLVGPGEQIALRVPAVIGNLRWRAFQNRPYLQFMPNGELLNQNGNFLYCPSDNNVKFADQIIVNRVGRVRRARDGDGDGVREDGQGLPLRCL